MAQPIIVAGATTERCAAVGPVQDHGAGPYSRRAGRVKRVVANSFDAVVPELLGDVGVDGPGGGEIAVGSARIALFPLRQSAAIERVRNLRVDVQGGREIVDRHVEFAELEIAEAAAVERVGVARLQPERRLAVLKALARAAENGLGQAPRIERVGVVGLDADRPVIVGQRFRKIVPVEMDIAAGIGVTIAIGIKPQRLVEIGERAFDFAMVPENACPVAVRNGDRVRPQVRDVSWMSGERGLQNASKFRTEALASYVGAQVQGVDGPPYVEEVEL